MTDTTESEWPEAPQLREELAQIAADLPRNDPHREALRANLRTDVPVARSLTPVIPLRRPRSGLATAAVLLVVVGVLSTLLIRGSDDSVDLVPADPINTTTLPVPVQPSPPSTEQLARGEGVPPADVCSRITVSAPLVNQSNVTTGVGIRSIGPGPDRDFTVLSVGPADSWEELAERQGLDTSEIARRFVFAPLGVAEGPWERIRCSEPVVHVLEEMNRAHGALCDRFQPVAAFVVIDPMSAPDLPSDCSVARPVVLLVSDTADGRTLAETWASRLGCSKWEYGLGAGQSPSRNACDAPFEVEIAEDSVWDAGASGMPLGHQAIVRSVWLR